MILWARAVDRNVEEDPKSSTINGNRYKIWFEAVSGVKLMRICSYEHNEIFLLNFLISNSDTILDYILNEQIEKYSWFYHFMSLKSCSWFNHD